MAVITMDNLGLAVQGLIVGVTTLAGLSILTGYLLSWYDARTTETNTSRRSEPRGKRD
jgi:hypothetical protein